MNVLRADAPVTPDQQTAQQMAQRELAQGKYHLTPSPTPPPPSSPPPTQPKPTPTPTPTHAAVHHASSGLTTLLVVVLIVVFGVVLLLVLRKIGKPRRGKDENKGKAKKTGRKKSPDEAGKGAGRPAAPIEIPLTGAALRRYHAERAAGVGDWQEAIRERFRAVIGVLDERGLLPERPDRTADEAARDAGLLLPEHADALRDSARAFDEVEYGEYAGTPAGYAVICAVDDAVSSEAAPAVRR